MKWSIWTTIIVAVISGAIALYTHFDSKEESNQITSKPQDSDKKETTSIHIEEIQLTPVDFDIPSSFYIEISNNWRLANDITVLIDFGKAKTEECAIKPNDELNISISGDEYILKVKVKELLKNESLYIYCLISLPAFKKIIVSGGNLTQEKIKTFSEYRSQEDFEPNAYWSILLSIIGTLLLVSFTFRIIFSLFS